MRQTHRGNFFDLVAVDLDTVPFDAGSRPHPWHFDCFEVVERTVVDGNTNLLGKQQRSNNCIFGRVGNLLLSERRTVGVNKEGLLKASFVRSPPLCVTP